MVDRVAARISRTSGVEYKIWSGVIKQSESNSRIGSLLAEFGQRGIDSGISGSKFKFGVVQNGVNWHNRPICARHEF